ERERRILHPRVLDREEPRKAAFGRRTEQFNRVEAPLLEVEACLRRPARDLAATPPIAGSLIDAGVHAVPQRDASALAIFFRRNCDHAPRIASSAPAVSQLANLNSPLPLKAYPVRK